MQLILTCGTYCQTQQEMLGPCISRLFASGMKDGHWMIYIAWHFVTMSMPILTAYQENLMVIGETDQVMSLQSVGSSQNACAIQTGCHVICKAWS